jgi:membrane-associated phospholipid phosphatase
VPDPGATPERVASPDPADAGAHAWDDDPQLRWVVPLWLLVAGLAVVTVVRSAMVGIPVKDPHGSVLLIRVAISCALFAVLTTIDVSLRRGLRGWSLRRTAGDLRRRWPRRRLAVAAAALLAYHLVYLCYHNLKSWDVLNRPRDAALLSVDRALFLGHSPAVLLHDLLGQHVAAYVLLVIYESFSTLVTVGVVAGVVLPRRIRDGCTFASCAAWVWVLGVGSYYLVPSLGPFESAPREFAGLPHTMIQQTQQTYLAQRAHLLAHPTAADAFAQVSAFASLHVAMTTFLLLMAVRFRLRRTTWAMAVFLTGTVLATVYLGWHFAVDDLAGALIAVVAVRLGTAMTGARVRVHPGAR